MRSSCALPMTAIGILALWLAGCSEGAVGGNTNPQACPAGCPTGTVCNEQTRTCVPINQPTPPPPTGGCTPPTVPCGATCVLLASDVNNCGSCGNACGANSTCQTTCVCQPGFNDCNGTRFDGCECAGACNGTQCPSAPAGECDPTEAQACGGEDKYCNNSRACDSCPTGRRNCDGTLGCECSGTCAGASCSVASKCEPSKSNDCGGEGAFCDSTTNECANCEAGKKNCDGTFGCECDQASCQLCNPTPPPPTTCDVSNAGACGDENRYCNAGTCADCPENKKNCDGKNDCETDGACSTTPPPTPQCDYYAANGCPDVALWCWQQQCTTCTPGFFNCNRTQGCECDGAGCNGTACAGSCTGGECPPPPPTCSDAAVNDCGSNTKWCYLAACTDCTPGFFNCNGTGGCECDMAGCSGTSCAGSCTGGECPAATCSAATVNSCSGPTRWCDGGTCADCAPGTLNCDGIGGCDACATSCSGTSCAAAPTSCSSSDPNACDLDEWCYNNVCTKCSSGFINCNGFGGCECNGSSCQFVWECLDNQCVHGTECCSRSTANSCSNSTTYCALSGTCKACPPGTQNCDGKNDCECTTGCNGTSCVATTPSCSNTDPNACNLDEWCYNGTCTSCSAGYNNCNGVSGCECNSTCQFVWECLDGKCSGGECCSRSTAWSCGGVGKYCALSGTCKDCPGIDLNCDGKNDCEGGCT